MPLTTSLDPSCLEQPPATPLPDRALQRLRAVVASLNSTLDRAALGAWREPEQGRAAAVLDTLPAAVLLLDQRGHISDCNRAARELLGEGLVGRRWDTVVLSQLSASDDGTELVLHDGRRLSVATRPLREAQRLPASRGAGSRRGGVEGGQIVMLSDVSEARRLQTRLAQRSRLAEMGEMLARLAHQLGTPLATSALVARELTQVAGDDERSRDLAVRLEHALARLRAQVRDMQVFSSTSAVVSGKPTPVGEVLAALSEQVLPLFAPAGARLEIDAPAQAERVRVNAAALVSAFANLADNALQARPEGLVLRVAAHAGPRSVLFEFADNGPGIEAPLAARVFEPFYSTRETGSGLGLAVARSVVEAHGGTLSLASDPGGGCRFTVALPRQGAADPRGGQ